MHVSEAPATSEIVTSGRSLTTPEVADQRVVVEQSEDRNVNQSYPEQTAQEPLLNPQITSIDPIREEIKTSQIQTLEKVSQDQIPLEIANEVPELVISSNPVSTAVREDLPPVAPLALVEDGSVPVLHEEVIEEALELATPGSSSTEGKQTATKLRMDHDMAVLTIQCAARCFLAMVRFRIKKTQRIQRWIEALDPQSQVFFYYNTEKNFIQWQKPSDFLPGGVVGEEMVEKMNHELSIVLAKRKRKQSIKSLPRSAGRRSSVDDGARTSRQQTPPSARNVNASTNASAFLGPMSSLAAAQKKRPVTSTIVRKRVDLFELINKQPIHQQKAVRSLEEIEKHMAHKQHEKQVEALKRKREMALYKDIYNTARKNFQTELLRLRAQNGAPLALARYTLLEEDQEKDNSTVEPPSIAELKAIWATPQERRATACWEILEFQNIMLFRSVLGGGGFEKKLFIEEALRQRQFDIEQRIKRLEKKLVTSTSTSSSMAIAESDVQHQSIIQQAKKKNTTLLNLQFWKKQAQDRTTNFWLRFFNRLEKMQPGECHEFVLKKHTDDGDTLLHLVSWFYGGASGEKNGKEMLHTLITLGMNVNAIDNTLSRMTPLHEAARAGHVEACAFLLSAGARMDAIDASGETPLHWACRNNFIKVVRLLLQHAEQVETMQLQHNISNGGSTYRSTTSSITSTSTNKETKGQSLQQHHHHHHHPGSSAAPSASSITTSAEVLLSKSVVGMNLKCSLKEFFHLKNYRNRRAIDLVIKKFGPPPATSENNTNTDTSTIPALVDQKVKKCNDLAKVVTSASGSGSVLLEYLQSKSIIHYVHFSY
jgi:hypothetical protein